MEEYVYIDGKKYRRGYTTGSCAAGAAKAAAHMALTKNKINNINIDTPKGIPLILDIHNQEIQESYAQCSIQKDGGDDIDATHKIHIYANVQVNNSGIIEIDGGIGIGRVTKKGLGIEIGQAAINKTPRAMIENEVRKVIGNKGAKVTIYSPQGEEIAKKTFNPRLGIVGGISIIGTTGIVEPMSDEGWKKSLSIELQMKKEQGLENIVLVPGNHGERFANEVLDIDMKYVVRTSNFIGYMIKEAQRMGYKKILLAGHLGKYVKLAAGIFNTHSKVADARAEVLVAYLALMDVHHEILKEVYDCLTTEAAMEVINKYGYEDVYKTIANKCKERVDIYLDDANIDVGVIIFSMEQKILGKTCNIDNLLGVFKDD
jgi:cobalt-precorrin-5B (C1)-methyltransferase